MTNKERQAKLQYLLNSLSMTKEQKDIVVDLVNSSGNGGGNEPLIIKLCNDFYDLTVDDKEFKLHINSGTTPIDRYCYNPELFTIIKNAVFKNRVIVLHIVETEHNHTYIDLSYNITEYNISLSSFNTGENLQIVIYNEYRDE